MEKQGVVQRPVFFVSTSILREHWCIIDVNVFSGVNLMNELEKLFEELFPENVSSKTLRLKRSLESHFLASIKELTKQGVTISDAIDRTLDNLGGKQKIRKLIKKSNQSFFASTYFIVMMSLVIGYPLVLYIIYKILNLEGISLVFFIPFIIGAGMLFGKLNAYRLDAETNRLDELKQADNTAVFSGVGMRFKGKV